ncbi:hypothetical protein [Stagnihabitans tardus]|uniref:Uncharacterized protein n=1 Tax=Stagnihabitans tardus TaxID=2699202 RepID=A0AAE4YBL8_9RHOB|nr:hypothetical protein [Stagnihabitans tardus]NBZ89671.1 hypothetical protein [Stagnihabitans tardus]
MKLKEAAETTEVVASNAAAVRARIFFITRTIPIGPKAEPFTHRHGPPQGESRADLFILH